MSLVEFEIIKELGKGSFGSVYKVKRKVDNEIYALKMVGMTNLKFKEKFNSLNEIRVLASINHPNIISYKEAFYDIISSNLCIIMEYADNGDLEEKISFHIKRREFFKEAEIWRIFLNILNGIKQLHEMKILHRDIKAANIFMFKDNKVKIGDLNVSKEIKMGMLRTQTGTPYYASPEVWNEKPYDYESDMWSIGCLLYELASLKPPFRGSSMKAVSSKVTKGAYEDIPSQYSKLLSNTIYSLLQLNPTLRPTAKYLLSYLVNKLSINTLENTNNSGNIIRNNFR